MRGIKTLITGMALAFSAVADDRPPPLPIEPIGVVESLPATYPNEWLLVHEASFFNMQDGKIIVLDASAETLTEQYKGMVNISLMGNYLQNSARSEIYATETFHTRGNRGDRFDVLTVWDMATLSSKGEVMLPGNKRFMGMPEPYALLLINDGKWLAVSNLSPATSVTIVDVERLNIVSEIPTPGCTFAYPTGNRGFSSLCADGRMMSTTLKADGTVQAQVRTEAFFSSDDSPIFERPVVIDGTAYFPTVAGLMQPVDVSGDVAVPGEAWSIVTEEEKAKAWAPAGIALMDRDDAGLIYLLMHPDAVDGSYQAGGPEVWVIDPKAKKTLRKIALNEWGLSLAVTKGDSPMLAVLNPTVMSIEIYDPNSGELVRTLSGFGENTPLSFSGSE